MHTEEQLHDLITVGSWLAATTSPRI